MIVCARIGIVSLLGSLLAAPSVVYAGPFFLGLGDLPGGRYESHAAGVSADGSVVVGWGHSAPVGSSHTEAFRWTATEGIVGLGGLPGGDFGVHSKARAVSADGLTIAGTSNSDFSVSESCLWTVDRGVIPLRPGAGSSTHYLTSSPADIADDGRTVVGQGQLIIGGQLSYRWRPPGSGGFSQFHWLTPTAVSADGALIAGYKSSPTGSTALLYRWDDHTEIPLGDLPGGGTSTVALEMTSDGSVVVGYGSSDVGTEPFRWTAESGIQSLGPLPAELANGAKATAVSADGSIIVGKADPFANQGAFIWNEDDGVRLLVDVLANDYGLDLEGWLLYEATDISADGLTVVGTGVNPSGRFEAYVAHIPEPSTLLLLAFGSVTILSGRKRKYTDRNCRTSSSA